MRTDYPKTNPHKTVTLHDGARSRPANRGVNNSASYTERAFRLCYLTDLPTGIHSNAQRLDRLENGLIATWRP